MADKWKNEGDEPVPAPGTEENIRGVATDDEDFEDADEVDEDELEEEEGGSTF